MFSKLAVLAASLASLGFAGTAPDLAGKSAPTFSWLEPKLKLPEMKAPAGECAIPLRELKGGDGRVIDPMAKTTSDMGFDKIGKPAKIQACRSERPAGK